MGKPITKVRSRRRRIKSGFTLACAIQEFLENNNEQPYNRRWLIEQALRYISAKNVWLEETNFAPDLNYISMERIKHG